MRRLPALASLTAAMTLAMTSLLAVGAPAVADGSCDMTPRYANEGYGVKVRMTTLWENCASHTHPKSFGIRVTFGSIEDEVDWEDDPDDYVTYTCKVVTDNRVLEQWSGRLSYNDRTDGVTFPAAKMYYPNHPRTRCWGKIVEDFEQDTEFDLTKLASP